MKDLTYPFKISKKDLAKRIANVTKQNEGLKPYQDKDYVCGTCKNPDSMCNPDTAYCRHCDTDNWVPINEFPKSK